MSWLRRLVLCTDRYGRRTHLREGQSGAVQQFPQGVDDREVTLDADHLMFVDERGVLGAVVVQDARGGRIIAVSVYRSYTLTAIS